MNHKTLANALLNRIKSGNARLLNEKNAKEMALYVLNFFGYETEAVDYLIDDDTRKLFSILEDAGILKTREEETVLHYSKGGHGLYFKFRDNGKEWRTHYWMLNVDNINKFAEPEHKEESMGDAEFSYGNLPENVWDRQSSVRKVE